MIVFCIEGSGASSSRGNPLSNAVVSALDGYDFELHTFEPDHFVEKADRMVKIAVENGVGNYLFAAKSIGAFELFENLGNLLPILDCANNRIAIVTVDPHAAFWQCGPGHPINAMWLTMDDYRERVRSVNVYQRCRYPRGAVVVGADENTEVKGTTHSRIVKSQEAHQAYSEAASWLVGG